MINKIFLALTAITYGWLGGWALFNPSDYVSAVGLSINSDLGSAELRAVYGGINFLIALYALLAFFKTKHEKSFFKILLFIISGILLGLPPTDGSSSSIAGERSSTTATA